jgi:GNAT superfamily N-acetyltransferase
MTMMSDKFTIREAGPEEQAVILHHRRSMFRDMGEGTIEELDRMVEAARPWLARAVQERTYRHWLAIDDIGQIAGGGGVLLSPWPPNPLDPSPERAIILNVYTEREFRHRGVAQAIMRTIVAWVEQQGLRAVNLHASAEGRQLYEKLGFEATNEMRLWFGKKAADATKAAGCNDNA